MKKQIFWVMCLFLVMKNLCHDNSSTNSNNSEEINEKEGISSKLNQTGQNKTNENIAENKAESVYTLPEEILKYYALYETLEDYNKTCGYENIIDGISEEKLKLKIIRDKCIPNAKTLAKILEAGWSNLSNYLVTEVYLPKLIDPTNTIYTYIQKYESQVNKFKQLIDDISKYEKIPIPYNFENFDTNVKIAIKLPDSSYVLEYLSVYCYKDLLKIHALFRSRQKLVRITDSKNLFDIVESDCENIYNPYDHQIEITLNKLNKLKQWTTLFK